MVFPLPFLEQLTKIKKIKRYMGYPPMGDLEKVLEKLRELFRRLIEALLGSEPQPEFEPIPIPVKDRSR
jgi:hypothetical protein